VATLREIITKITFRSDSGKLKATEQGVRKVKKRMSQAAKETRKYRKNMAQLTGAMKAFGAAIVANRIGKALIGGFADEADAAAKFSDATGILVDDYLALGHAANLSGVQQAELDKSLMQLSNRALMVTQGNKTYARSFAQLGVSVTDAAGKLKDPKQLFLEMADQFQKMPAGVKKTGLAMQLFGRTGAKLNVMFANGSKGIREQMEEFKKLGGGYTRAQAAQAELYNDQKARLIVALKGVRNQIAVKLLPAINRTTERMLSWVREGGNVSAMLAKIESAAKLAAPAIAALVVYMKRGILLNFARAVGAAANALMLMGKAAIWAKLKMGILLLAIGAIVDVMRLASGQESVLGRMFADSPEALASLQEVGKVLIDTFKGLAKDLGPTLAAAFSEIVPALAEVLVALKPAIPGLVKILVLVIKLVAWWVKKVAPIFAWFLKIFLKPLVWISKLIAYVADLIDETVDLGRAWDWIAAKFRAVVGWLKANLGGVFAWAANIAKGAWHGVLIVFNAIKTAIAWILDKSERVAKVVKNLGAKGVLGTLGGGIGSLTGAVGKTEGGGNTTVNRAVNTGPVNVTVNAAPNWSGGEFQRRVGDAVEGALQRRINDAWRTTSEVQ
jgi:hypothetical protein